MGPSAGARWVLAGLAVDGVESLGLGVVRRQLAAILGCEAERLDRELDALAARARARSAKIRITSEIRDRAPTAATPSRTSEGGTSPPASGSSTRPS